MMAGNISTCSFGAVPGYFSQQVTEKEDFER